MRIKVAYFVTMPVTDQSLIILTSPPASGKTYWISSLKAAFPQQKILVISPLRALADECHANWKESIFVMTPEEWLGKKMISDIVIFDEFHLFYYWGDSFRPSMWEAFYEIVANCQLTILLTATLSLAMKRELTLLNVHFDSITWVDHGNQKLKYLPSHYFKAPSSRWMLSQIENEPVQKSVKLIFCQYRQEVFDLERRLSLSGFTCISCVGGEARYMKDKLLKTPRPDYIISTTVLSHGVNLPEITRVYFLYKIENIDFWIQMVARGGRRGQNYQVFALERPFHLKWNPFRNFLSITYLTLKQKLSLRSISL